MAYGRRRRYQAPPPPARVDPKRPGKIMPAGAPDASTMKPWQTWLECGAMCTPRAKTVLTLDPSLSYEQKEGLRSDSLWDNWSIGFYAPGGAGFDRVRGRHGDTCVYIGEYSRVKTKDPFTSRPVITVRYLFLMPSGPYLASPEAFEPLESAENSIDGV